MYINWTGRCVEVYNDYNAKMSVIYTDTDVQNAVLQGEQRIVVMTKDRVNVYKRAGNTFCFYLWTSTPRVSF